MKFSIYQLFTTLFIISFISCKVTQSVNNQPTEIYSKEVDGITIFYYDGITYDQQNTAEAPERNYVDTAFGIEGREIIKRNWRALFKKGNESKWEGKIGVMICVNREGEVKYAEILPNETTITEPERLKQALIAAKGYLVEADQNAALEECGKLIFNIDVNGRKK